MLWEMAPCLCRKAFTLLRLVEILAFRRCRDKVSTITQLHLSLTSAASVGSALNVDIAATQ
jgi:hypothetical protein